MRSFMKVRLMPMMFVQFFIWGCPGSSYLDDQNIAPQFRAQAQGFFVLLSYGVGQGLGTLIAGFIFNSIMSGDSATPAQWQTFWLIPLLFAVVVIIMFAFGFKAKVSISKEEVMANWVTKSMIAIHK